MYKKIIALLCVFLLTINIYSKEAHADPLGGALIGGLMLDGSAVAGAIVAAGPYVAAFAVLCIGAGVVYNNKDEIEAGLINAYNYAKSQGKNLMDYFSTGEDGTVKVNSEGVGLITGSVKSYLANPSVNGNLGVYSVSPGSKFDINILIEGSGEYFLKLGTDVRATGSISAFINGDEIGTGLGAGLKPGYYQGTLIHLIFDSSGWKYNDTIVSVDSTFDASINSLKYQAENNIFSETSESICADFSIKINNFSTANYNISVDRLLPNSIGNTQSVDSDVTFKNPSLELDKDISIPIPNSVTWDKVIDKTWDNTIPVSDVGTIDIPGVIPVPSVPDFDTPGTSTLDFSPLYLSLQDKFPFSVPFDLINTVKMFESNRVTPVFNVKFDEGLIGGGEFQINFSKFDKIATLLRFFVLLYFILFLIKISKSMATNG